jgi:sugar phosphate isomerase/epimerase
MKVGALDVMFFDIPLKKRLDYIRKIGFDGTELWLTSAEVGFKVEREWPASYTFKHEYINPVELSNMARESNITIAAFGQYTIMGPTIGPFPTEVVTGEGRKERIEDIKKLLTYAVEAGSKIVICESGGDCDKLDQWNTFVEDFMLPIVSHAEKVDAILAIENTPHNLIKDDDDLLNLMKIFKSKSLKVAFDPANLNLTPPGNRDIYKAVKKLADYIVVVHAKDSIYGGGKYGKMPDGTWNCPPIGKGTVSWNKCIKALKEISYKGWLIVEYSYPFKEVSLKERELAAIEGKDYLLKLLGEDTDVNLS